MKSRQYPLILLTTTLLVVLTGRSSFAFSLTGSTNSSSTSPYILPDGSQGVVSTAQIAPLAPPKGTDFFSQKVKKYL